MQKKLGNVEKHFGNIGKWLIIRNLFTNTHRYTCTKAHLMGPMDEHSFIPEYVNPNADTFVCKCVCVLKHLGLCMRVQKDEQTFTHAKK